MLYRNKTTGVIIDVPSEIKGDWEPVEAPSAPAPAQEEKPAKGTKKRATK